jgi:hypothetical protein
VGGRRSGGAPILLLVGARLAAGRHGARWCGGRARDGEETGAAGPIDFLSRMVPNISGISGRFYIRGWICSCSRAKQLQEQSGFTCSARLVNQTHPYIIEKASNVIAQCLCLKGSPVHVASACIR